VDEASWSGTVARFITDPPKLPAGHWLYIVTSEGDPLYVGMTTRPPVARLTEHFPRAPDRGRNVSEKHSSLRKMAEYRPEIALGWTIQIFHVCGDEIRNTEARTIWEMKPKLNLVHNPHRNRYAIEPEDEGTPVDTWASRLILRTRDLGLTKTDLGQMVGVHPRQVQRWVNGRSKPRFEHIQRLAHLEYVIDGLVEIFDASHVVSWFNIPTTTRRNSTPYQLMVDGKLSLVVKALNRTTRVKKSA